MMPTAKDRFLQASMQGVTDPYDVRGEVWAAVPRFPGYEVSNFGRVRRYTLLAQHKQNNRLAIELQRGRLLEGRKKREHRYHTYVHRLVAIAFLGEPPSANHEVNHRDGNPLNNHVKNLEWVTRQQNHDHARQMGLYGRCLTPKLVRQAQFLAENGVPLKLIASRLNIGLSTVYKWKAKGWDVRRRPILPVENGEGVDSE